MAEVAVEYLTRKLEVWSLMETNKQRAAQLNNIKTGFIKIRPFLKDADWRRMIAENDSVGKWVSDVINLAYEVEDVIDDEFCYKRKEAAGPSLSSFLDFLSESINYTTSSNKPQMSSTWIPVKVFDKLKELEVRRKHLSLFGDIKAAKKVNPIRYSKSFATQKHPLNNIVGRSKEVTTLKELLLCESEVDRPDLVAVTGTGGIGKTIVARQVYEHVQRYFDCCAWVFVSGHSAASILRNIFIGFCKGHSEMMAAHKLDKLGEKELAKAIYEYVAGKKFLLVLDDLDTLNAWEEVKCALPLECRGKVLMTTRNSAFPAVICKHVLHVEPLMAGEALDLLRQQALFQQYDFGEVDWSSSVKSVEDNILQICEGVPFAVATIGATLSTINLEELRDWNEILRMLEEVNQRRPQANPIEKVLMVCYFSLPPMMKCCLLYCGMFPSHYEIHCKRLIRLWVAEGFTGRQLLGMTEEETAKYLLDELLQRNLLEVSQVSENEEVVSCRLLELVQDFILEMSKKDLFCTVLDSNRHIFPSKASRFLAVHGKINNITPSLITKEIRSLHLFSESRHLTPSILLNSLSGIKHLHVLDLQQIPIDTLPDALGDLVQLRYLDLRGTRLHELPSSLKNLCELQTLDIRNTPIRIMPSGFDSLKMMKHLLLADSYSNRVVKLDMEIMLLKDLQTLAGVRLTHSVALGLKHLPQLLKLSVGEVEGGNNSLHLSESINQMKELNSLTIRCSWRKEIQIQISNPLENLEKLRVGGWVRDLLSWVSRLKSLKYLHLWDCSLSQDPISSLQHLPNLVVLSLCNAYNGKQVCCNDPAGFPKLKRLSILRFEEVSEWTKIEDGAMVRLHTIIFSCCPKLNLPPKGLENLKDLKTLQITGMPAQFVKEAREIPLHAE